jgi:asparagine synthase (glutamine-hydrolysing)
MIGGIAGVFYRKSERDRLQSAFRVRKAIELLGPVGSYYSVLDTFNSVVFGRMTFSFYEQSARMPISPQRHNCTITANCLLLNKLGLVRQLNIPVTTEDSEIILISYLKWGKQCVHRLEGKFTFAIWNDAEKELFCAKSCTSLTDFVFYTDKNQFIFGTEIKSVIEILGRKPPINKEFIAEHIDGIVGNLYSTTYEEIKHLPPGFSITVTTDSLRMDQYWKPEQKESIVFKKDSDYAEAASELLTTVLKGYVDTGFDLSIQLGGGMNAALLSSYITELQKKPLTAVSYVLPKMYSGDLQDEKSHTEVLKNHLNLDLHYVNEPNFPDPFDEDIEKKMWMQDSPIVNPVGSDHYVVFGKMKELGTQICLSTGFKSLDWSGAEAIPTLFRQGKFVEAFRYSRYQQTDSFFKNGVRAFLPSSTVRVLKDLKRNLNNSFLAHPDIVSTYDLKHKLKEYALFLQGEGATNSGFPTQLESINRQLYRGKKYTSAQEYRYNFILCNPLLDRRLIDFSLSIPRVQHQLNGERRSLLKRMLAGKVPPIIYEKPMQISYPADMRDRWLNAKSHVFEHFEKIAVNSEVWNYVNRKKAIELFEKTKLSTAYKDWRYNRADLANIIILDRFLKL